MGTYVSSFFFHEDHNKLSVEDIRNHGFAAKAASNGFVEAFPYTCALVAQKELELKRELSHSESMELYELSRRTFLELLINNVKSDCPPIMHYLDDMDDGGKLTIYHSPTVTEKIEDCHYSGRKPRIPEHLKTIFGLKNFYTDIGFARYTEQDLPTENQLAHTKNLKQELEDYQYANWKVEFEKLTERQKLKRLFSALRGGGRSLSCKEDKALYEDRKFIERFSEE